MKVSEVIETILTDSCGETRIEKTHDILMSGSPDSHVTSIVTTFMATVDVIRAAIHGGANLIITHEPTYYSGMDQVDWLRNDPVYLAKLELIKKHEINIWRYHDHMHMAKPDRIYQGLLRQLGWHDQHDIAVDSDNPWTVEIKPTTVKNLALFLKDRLNMKTIQIVGSEATLGKRIGILVGGGSLGFGREEMPAEFMRDREIDIVICGEIVEWSLCAYVNDASSLGLNKAMIVVGHERTEEWGMKYMAEWLRPLVGSVPVRFIDAKEPFIYV